MRGLERLLVDRTEVDSQYSVLTHVPLPDATEQLMWTTNIFIAMDLSETRTDLSVYPAMTITYTFSLSCSNRSLFTGIETDSNQWLIPYYPHLTQARDDASGTHPIGGVLYPYYRWAMFLTRNEMVFKQVQASHNALVTDFVNPVDSTVFSALKQSDEIYVAPCFFAQIKPQVTYSDVGKYVDGSTVSLTFRMTAESERELNYHVATFDHLAALQRPLATNLMRHQSDFSYKPAPSYTFTPFARRQDHTPKVTANYWLNYNRTTRDDYAFRGFWMQALGSKTAGHYIDSTKLHRIENDLITIKYDKGKAIATVTMREVAA